MFNLSFLMACSLIFYMNTNYQDIISLIFSNFLLFNSLISIIIFLKYNQYFRKFRFTFRCSTITFYHYILHIICISISIITMAILTDFPWIPFIPQTLLIIYTIIQKPYNYLIENIRSCFNLLVMVAITSMKVYVFYIDN